MKRLLKIFFIALLLVSITGCKMKTQKGDKTDPNYVINKGRDASGYKYDWIDFIEYTIYGSNGTAYIEVSPRNLKSSDFQSDEDFIKVQSVINNLNLNYSPNLQDINSRLSVSPGSNLSSGDVVTFSLTTSIDSSLNIYTEEYEIRVPELDDCKTIDLFSNDLVTFYGVSGGNSLDVGYLISNDTIDYPEELLANLTYSISLKNVSSIEKDKTVVTVTAGLNSDFMKANGYKSITNYLNKIGYTIENTEKQIVLHEIATAINFTTVKKESVINALFTAVSNAEMQTDGKSILNQICTVQKLNKDSDTHTYYVVYQDMNSDGNIFYFRRQFRAVDLDGTIIVLSMQQSEQTKEEYATGTSYENGQVLLNNMVIEQEQTEEAEENGEEDVKETSESEVGE